MSDMHRGHKGRIVKPTALPAYRSHKVVHAARILAIHWCLAPNRGARLDLGPEYEPVDVSGEYVERHHPEIGGYYVRYADAYESFSPAKAFEEGYTRIEPEGR